MTAEEIAKFEQLSVPEPGTPSDTERINALETLFLELSGGDLMNAILLEILKRKITSGAITTEDIKNGEYKQAIIEWKKTI